MGAAWALRGNLVTPSATHLGGAPMVCQALCRGRGAMTREASGLGFKEWGTGHAHSWVLRTLGKAKLS